MNKSILLQLLTCCALLIGVKPGLAEAPKPGTTYVVLVGISKYQDAQILPRPTAEEDVKALYDLMTDKKYLGATAENTRLLLGSEDAGRKSKLATRENVVDSLRWLKNSAKPEDLVVIGFIGQGGTLTDLGERLCYFTHDSTVKDRAKTALAASDVSDELKDLKAQRVSVFLDANFKGFKTDKGEAPVPNLLEDSLFREFLGSEGKDDKAPLPGRVVFYSSIGKHPSPDLKKHGAFTEALVAGMKGEADKEGYEADGVVTVDELTVYVEKQVLELVRKEYQKQEDKLPIPVVFGGRSTHFVLVQNPTVQPKVQERLTNFEKVSKDAKFSETLLNEGKQMLTQMPKLKAQQDLRKAYQQLADKAITAEQFQTTRDTILAKTKLSAEDAQAFAQRVMDAVQVLSENYVKKVQTSEMVTWAIKGLYRRLDEKIPTEVLAKLEKADTLKNRDLQALLVEARLHLGVREDLANGKDLDISLQRMMGHLDPYTTYIDPETSKQIDRDVSGNFTGIGIQIRKDATRDQLQVISPLRNSPAFKAGLQAGDIITKITCLVDDKKGEPLEKPEEISTKGLPISQAIKKILGFPGTPVKLTVDREGTKEPLEFTVERGRIETESVLGVKRNPNLDWDFMLDSTDKIAYIRLTSFQENSARDMEKAMKDLKALKVKGVVLDLRFNPGGLLDSAVKISDLFVDDGLIVSIKPRVGRERKFTGFHDGSYLDFPMVCMVNGGSASGSEIVSACLQDHHRAVIVGERSFGKGSVQNIMKFQQGSQIKMTTASFWRPNGKNLNKSSTGGKDEDEWGVSPDKGFEIKLTRKETEELAEHQQDVTIIPRKDKPTVAKEFKDRQLEKSLEYLREQIARSGRADKK